MTAEIAQLVKAEITFPSKGLLYGDRMPGGVAHVRAWTTAEIKLLVSARKGKKQEALERAIDRVIDNCLFLPNGMKPDELLYTDGFYALIAQRINTYDSMFKSEFKCRECSWKNPVWIDLHEDLNPIELSADVKEPLEVHLPVLGVPVTLTLLRRKDAKRIAKYSKNKLERAPQEAEFGDPGFSYRIAIQIETIDGEKVGVGEKIPWVDSLHARDFMAIENALEDAASGIDPKVTKTCQHPDCGEESSIIVPMNLEFFRPRITFPGTNTGDAGRA